tara:strand:- start:8478 stop:8768 length:291 start_codon:yes stop_codon:yes gene_type:complete
MDEGSYPVAALAQAMLASREAGALLLERIEFGKKKYGTALHTHNGRDPWIDWLQEQLDGVQYAAQMLKEETWISKADIQVAMDLLGAQMQALSRLG